MKIRLIKPSPFKVIKNRTISVHKMTFAEVGDQYYQYKSDDGILVYIPVGMEFAGQEVLEL